MLQADSCSPVMAGQVLFLLPSVKPSTRDATNATKTTVVKKGGRMVGTKFILAPAFLIHTFAVQLPCS